VPREGGRTLGRNSKATREMPYLVAHVVYRMIENGPKR